MFHPANHAVLRRFKDALIGIYGDQIDRVILFGSRARGDATASFCDTSSGAVYPACEHGP
jgi:hypothetical protein